MEVFAGFQAFPWLMGIDKIEGEIALLSVQGLAGRIDFFFRKFSSAAETEERRRS
jgi:hypothetical protein